MNRSIDPIPGESFNGLLHRWAAANFIDRMMDVTSAAGVEYSNIQDAALNAKRDLAQIAAITGIALRDLQSRALPIGDDCLTRHFCGVPVRKSDIEIWNRCFAPGSLRLSPHHRALWMIRTLPFCIESWQYLQSTCHRPQCGADQRWTTTLGIERCDRCLADLRAAPVEYVSEYDREALLEVAQLFDPVNNSRIVDSLAPSLAGITPGAAYELVIRLMKVVNPDLPVARTAIQTAHPRELSDAMAKAWRVLKAWPDGFMDIASARIAGRFDRGDGNSGETMRFLSLWRNRSQLSDPVARGVVKQLSDSIDVSRAENASMLLPLATAAGMVGVKQCQLSELRRRGVVETKFAIRRDRPMAAFDASEFEALQRAQIDRASLGTAQSLLGIAAHGVEEMIALGQLEFLSHPYFEARYASKSVSRSSLSILVGLLQSRSQFMSGVKAPLNIAMKIIGGRLKPWGAVFELLLRGDLPFELSHGRKGLVERIHIRRCDAGLLRSLGISAPASLAAPEFLSKQDVAETLNLGPVQATELLSEYVTLRGTRTVIVPTAVVKEYAQTYISAAELSWVLSVAQQTARSMARCAMVTHVRPAGYLRAEAVERLHLKY